MAEWTIDLATGIEEIDEQHIEIFKKADALLRSCREGKGKEHVGEMIKFLGDYVIEHFKAEESLQIRSMYPRYNIHKKLHADFIKAFNGLKEDFDAHGPTLTNVMATNMTVVDWLINHIKKEDKDLAVHITGRSDDAGRKR